jgi:hypothetical protein
VAQSLLQAADMCASRRLIVVRRGETGIFQALQESLDRWPEGTQVIWDRRDRDRRAAIRPITAERRRTQRRTDPDSMWYTHGFIVVETHGPPEETAGATGA